jgi:hypothetical protein
MNPRKAVLGLALSASAWVLSSCIDGREEYWLEIDGSGRAEAIYQIPEAVARLHGGEDGVRAMLREFIAATPEIKNSSLEVTTEGSQLKVKTSIAFDSALDLRDVASGSAMHELPDAASHLAGTIRADLHGRDLEFKRVVSAGKAIPGAGLLPASTWVGHSLTYIMHLPAAATTSNATRTEDSGKTLIWEFPLGQAVLKPVVTRFTMPVPIPWKWVAWITTPLALTGCAVFAWKRREKPAAGNR